MNIHKKDCIVTKVIMALSPSAEIISDYFRKFGKLF